MYRPTINTSLKTNYGLLTGVLILLCFCAPLMAQVSPSNIERELEKTDRLLDRARQTVEESGSLQGRQYLEKAFNLQKRAWDTYRQRRYRNAHRLTKQARDLATKSVGFVRQNSENREMVKRELEKTDEILATAHSQLEVSSSASPSQSLLENAYTTQTKAREMFTRNRQKMALTATMRARDLASLGLEQVREKNRIARELEKTDQYLEKARSAMSESDLEEIPPVILRALKTQEEAKILFKRGNYKLALRQTLTAREIIANALKNYERSMRKENFDRVVDDLEKRYYELSEIQSEFPNQFAEKLLKQAYDEYLRARQLYQENKTERAVYHMRRCDKFLTEAAQILKP